ncbi:MAG: hypothetical protein IJ141_04565 [Lachnospiraceae bacterium]|nr:hypothetical protein [Lachnospiraceae bacterium]
MILRKQISFDLDTKVMKKILGSSYTNTYEKIRKHFNENGFYRQEGSTYSSNDSKEFIDVVSMLYDMLDKYPFMEKCVRDMSVTEITEESSVNFLFDYDGTPGQYAQNESDIQNEADEYYDDFEM